MRVLVTGHDGYIGSVCAPLIRDAGNEVVGFDSYLFEGCSLERKQEEVPGRPIDLRDVEVEHLRGFDAVVHLAGISNDPMADLDPARTYEVNHRASVRLARLAKQAGVERLIFASSCSLYGAASPDDFLTESAPFNPVTPYAETKVLAERDVSELADDGFSPTFLRNATVYGYSSRLRLDLVVNDLAASAFATGNILIKSDGTAWRPLVHVEDASLAVLAALEAKREAVHNEAFNIGATKENYQVREIADIVTAVVPGSRTTYAEGGETDKRCYRVDFSKAEDGLPGFEPRWTVPEGVRELANAYARHGMVPEDLVSSRFVRLRRIQALQAEGRLGPDLRWISASASAVAAP
jgi:nucleoside-diphosphate-sugar epimerase